MDYINFFNVYHLGGKDMLLNYKEFQEKTKEEFLTYMSEEFKTGYTVHIEEKNLEKNVT